MLTDVCPRGARDLLRAGMLTSALALAACPEPGGSSDAATDVDATTLATTEVAPTGTTGDTADDPTADVSTTDGPPDSGDDPAAFFLPGRQGDAAFVLRISPATATVEPFGPALPVPADELGHTEVVPTPDHALVTVRSYLKADGSTATLFVGDGSTWTLVTKFNKFGLGQSSLAWDASLMWFDEIAKPDGTPTFQARVITPTGKLVFEGAPLPGDQSLEWRSFGPGGGWFTYHDPARGLVLRTVAGEETELAAVTTHVAFPNSVIVNDLNALHWVDLAGQPLAVPGFVAAEASVSRSGYQIADGQLSRLGDGEVVPLQKVPVDMRADQVYRHVDGAFAVGAPAPKAPWSTIGVDGGVISTFVPSPTPNVPPFGELETWHGAIASCLACPTRTIVFGVHNSVVDGDVVTSADSSIQLWSVDAQGETTAKSVLRPWKDFDWGPRDFHFSEDGSRLVWSEEGQLFHLDVQSAAVAPLESPFELLK